MDTFLQIDAYKSYHHRAMHPDVTHGYYNYTNRNDKYANVAIGGVVHFGLQYWMQRVLVPLANMLNGAVLSQETGERLFKYNIERYKIVMADILSITPADLSTEHLEALLHHGRLPLIIRSLPEGTIVPYGVPPFTIETNIPGFAWFPGLLETSVSQHVWPMSTSCTTAASFFKLIWDQQVAAGNPLEGVPFMGHDFSARGMFGPEAAAMSGMAHAAAGFLGSDTVQAYEPLRIHYDARPDRTIKSVDATEHSVTCTWGEEQEANFIAHCLQQTPTGILSMVADTWNLWKFIMEKMVANKAQILLREGQFVVRPDSGDPVDILCGTCLSRTEAKTPEEKGVIQLLIEEFGCTTNDKGFDVLNPKVGAIYGDAITPQRALDIGMRLMNKGISPTVVYGIGSYTYQGVTRDTHGTAIKMTAMKKGRKWEGIQKNPITDPNKKSAKGLMRVDRVDGVLTKTEGVTHAEMQEGELKVVFDGSQVVNKVDLDGVRDTVFNELKLYSPGVLTS